MPSLGPAEILVILVVALLVFGPNKMPDVARQAGKAYAEFRRVQQHLRSEIHGAMSDLNPTDVGNPSSTTAPEASDMMGGGDPVPMLPPKAPAATDPPSGGSASDDATAEPAAAADGSDPPSTRPADPS
jgi:sec-independent protein translocase protein TatA